MEISIIIPVYNEEKTVYEILKTIFYYKKAKEVLVVNDGSTDDTYNQIYPIKGIDYADKIKIIHLPKNTGKGNAVKVAFDYVSSDMVLLLDADLVGLKENHLNLLVNGILNNNADMVIGLRDKKNLIKDKLMPYFPLTGGERAIKTSVLKSILKCSLIEGWGLEAVMNDYCKKKHLKVITVKLDDLDHIAGQTKKYGILSFVKECYDVIFTKIKLMGVKY